MGNTSFANSRNNAEDQRSWKLAKAVHCKLYVMQTVQTLAKKKGYRVYCTLYSNADWSDFRPQKGSGYLARYKVTQTAQTLAKDVAGMLHVIK